MNSKMFSEIKQCRICGNPNLITVLDLGEQYLSGIFPKEIDLNLHKGPLTLVKCDETFGGCGHVQLQHTFHLPTMYGDEYGYRSGLNSGMVKHLQSKYEKIFNFLSLKENDLVIDIAGNDGTFLGFFSPNLKLVSIDPTSKKFSKYYKSHVDYIPNFFSEELYKKHFQEQKAKLITSFAMFYDLEDPCRFAKEINNVLDETDGIWVLEQSYMPEMLKMNSFDTVCHEHLSYYGMRQIKYIMDKSNFKIIDFEFNDINGGSISIVVANKKSKYVECVDKISSLIGEELESSLDTVDPWKKFEENIKICKNELLNLINELTLSGEKIAALGASTKGNVILQTFGISSENIRIIGDVNSDKYGAYTPGTWIQIEDEDEVLKLFDYFIILPWHFKKFFLSSEKFKGKTLIFPLPKVEIVKL